MRAAGRATLNLWPPFSVGADEQWEEQVSVEGALPRVLEEKPGRTDTRHAEG